MNSQRFLGGLLCLAFIVCYSENVKAQNDQCRDVLQNGIFQTSRVRENNYFQQIIYSRFLSSTYEQSKNDRALGFGVPVGEIVIGGDYSESQFKNKKKAIEKEGFNSITANREIDVALTSGDPEVLRHWSECMNSKGGVALRFEPASATEVFATLEWFPTAGITETKLDEDITLPTGVIVSQGAGCFKRERVLIATRPCIAVIIFPDALTTYPVAVNTPHAATRAYLPPRIELKREIKNYELKSGDTLYAEAFRTYKTPIRVIKLSDEEIAEGWTFDVSSARLAVERLKMDGNNYCREHQKADSYSFTYGFNLEGNRNGSGKNSTAICRVTPSIMLMRERWVPKGSRT